VAVKKSLHPCFLLENPKSTSENSRNSMTSNLLSSKRFTPTAPDKGSFPLDHEGSCKLYMLRYMSCLTENRDDNSKCRDQAKKYLECRMENNLMAKEDWSKLGFSEANKEAPKN
jgi:cytochrome c oxidase assembly protein subunit 19